MAIANPLKLRRGLVSAVAGATMAAGEPVFTTDQVRLIISDGSTKHVVGLKDNPDASASPGVNDDGLDGYSPGSHWIDTTGATAWVCLSAATGAAVWSQLGASGITQLTGHVTAGPGSGSQAATIAAGVIVDSMVAGANKDGAAATPSLRTLGTGAAQAAAGNHTHTGLSVQVAGTPSVRQLGTGSTDAAAGDDSRITVVGLTAAQSSFVHHVDDDVSAFYDVSATALRKETVSRQVGRIWHSDVRLERFDANNLIVYPGKDGGVITLYDGDDAAPIAFRIPTEGFGIAPKVGDVAASTVHDVVIRSSKRTATSADPATDIITLSGGTSPRTGSLMIPTASVGGITAGNAYWWRQGGTGGTGTLHALNPNQAFTNASKVNLTSTIACDFLALEGDYIQWSGLNTRTSAMAPLGQFHNVYVRTGSIANRLIGTVLTNAAGAFVDTATQRYVHSLFGVPVRTLWNPIGYNANNAATTFTHGTTLGELSAGGSKVEWVSCFGGNVSIKSRILASASGSGAFRWCVFFDSTNMALYGDTIATSASGTHNGASDQPFTTPGYHYAAMYGLSDAGSATVQADRLMTGLGITDMSTTNITATVWG